MKRTYQQPTIALFRSTCQTSFFAGSGPNTPTASDGNKDIASIVFGTTKVSSTNSAIL